VTRFADPVAARSRPSPHVDVEAFVDPAIVIRSSTAADVLAVQHDGARYGPLPLVAAAMNLSCLERGRGAGAPGCCSRRVAAGANYIDGRRWKPVRARERDWELHPHALDATEGAS
jgi:hypothetical protein